jgi:small subunit ribosomal protein S21
MSFLFSFFIPYEFIVLINVSGKIKFVKIQKSLYIYIKKQKKYMIIIKVKNAGSIEQALKQYKFKVYKTKQLEKLRERQEFTKKSVKKREQNKKAGYLQKKKTLES